MPWALLLAIGAYWLLVGLWSFAFVVVCVCRAHPSGPVTMSPAMRVEYSRLLLSYAAFIASGLLWWVCAFRCRRGAWRSALYTGLLAAALLASFPWIWPGHDALP